MADSNKIDLKAVKALSKQQRSKIAYEIRKDADLWDAVNGLGGLSELSDNARIQGTITNNSNALEQANVKILEDNKLKVELKTNKQGYFKTDIVPGNYDVKISFDGDTEDISVKAIKGVTSTVNHNFKSDGGGGVFK